MLTGLTITLSSCFRLHFMLLVWYNHCHSCSITTLERVTPSLKSTFKYFPFDKKKHHKCTTSIMDFLKLKRIWKIFFHLKTPSQGILFERKISTQGNLTLEFSLSQATKVMPYVCTLMCCHPRVNTKPPPSTYPLALTCSSTSLAT